MRSRIAKLPKQKHQHKICQIWLESKYCIWENNCLTYPNQTLSSQIRKLPKFSQPVLVRCTFNLDDGRTT